MITMLSLGENGRLGNQLFQYAMLKSVSIKLNYDLKIPDITDKNFHGQTCMLSNFKISAPFLSSQDYNVISKNFFETDSVKLDHRVFEVEDDTNFSGIYINKDYFISESDSIRDEFEFVQDLHEYSKGYISKFRQLVGMDKEIVSVHIRRGDTTDGTNPELVNYYGIGDSFSNDSIFGKYFNKAKELFREKDVVYLVFTGGSRKNDNSNDSDIEWCKKNIMGENFYYSENNTSIQDFAIMSMCDHNIIGHETTFSWWAGFLNKNPGKIVVAPKNWFFSQESRNTDGFYPPDFVCV